MTHAQFSRLCAAFWRHAKADQVERTYEVYAEVLGQLPPDAIDKAIAKVIKAEQRMPSAAGLYEVALSMIPRRFGSNAPEVDGCKECGGQPEQSVRDDGRLWRFYLRHTPECVNPVFAKLAVRHDGTESHWRDHWEQAGHATYLPIEDDDKPNARKMIQMVAKTLASPTIAPTAHMLAGGHR